MTLTQEPSGSELDTQAPLPGVMESALRWSLCAAVTVPLLAAVCLTGPVSARVGNRIFKLWARAVLRIFGISIDVEDRSQGNYARPPYIFVLLNQASILEVCYWLIAIPFEFTGLMNIEYALLPLLGWATWAVGGVAIVRQWPWHARRGIGKVEAKVRSGESMVISIEGRRSHDGLLSPYKKGPVVTAIRTGATLVPLVFHGARARLPVGSWRVRPGRVRVTLCEPIAMASSSYDDRDAFVERLRGVAATELRPRSAVGVHQRVVEASA